MPAVIDDCNGRDDDCDGNVDEDELTRACGSNTGECIVGTQSCVDGDWEACIGAVEPGDETCGNGADEDCDGNTDEGCACTPGATMDCGDSNVGECVLGTQTCDGSGAWGPCEGAVLEGIETCNSLDDDCDGTADESVRQISYRDADMDGFGTLGMQTEACGVPDGYVTNATDCDDGNADVRPGATETCNDVDDDCDDTTDEGLGDTYYADRDADGYGSATDTIVACSQPPGYVTDSTDCDDDCVLCRPGFPEELCGDGADNDCNGSIEGASCRCTALTAGGNLYVACNRVQVTWSEARAICMMFGGDLAFPDTDAENAALIAALNALDLRDYWIGGTDSANEDTWRRVDGTRFTDCEGSGCRCTAGDCNWAGGEPNDSRGEDCLEMRTDGLWNDQDCGDDDAFVCEGPF